MDLEKVGQLLQPQANSDLVERNSDPEPEPMYDEKAYEANLLISGEDGLGRLGIKKDPDGDELLDVYHYAYYYDDSEEDVSYSEEDNGEDIEGLDVPGEDPSAGTKYLTNVIILHYID